MEKGNIRKILREIESGYDQMSEKFSGTRNFFWPDFNFLTDYVQAGEKVLDFGCGNGRLLELFPPKEIDYWGVDISGELVRLAQKRYPQYQDRFQKISGQGSLPFADNFFNVVFSVAVFHHFPTNYSFDMAQELYRLIQPGGKVIITTWNLWQPRFRKNIWNKEVLFQKILQRGNYKGLGLQDIYIPFQNNKGEIFDRYHHAYTKKDLIKIFQKAGFQMEKCEVLNEKNIIYIGKK